MDNDQQNQQQSVLLKHNEEVNAIKQTLADHTWWWWKTLFAQNFWEWLIPWPLPEMTFPRKSGQVGYMLEVASEFRFS